MYIPMTDLVKFFIEKELMDNLYTESDSQEYFSKKL